MNKKIQKLIVAFMMSGISLFMAGCGSDNEDTGGSNSPPPPPPSYDISGVAQLEENQVAIYYKREDNNYDGWGLYLWDEDGGRELADGVSTPDWDNSKPYDGISKVYGAYYILDLKPEDAPAITAAGDDFNFIIHSGGEKNCEVNQSYSIDSFGRDVFASQAAGCELNPGDLAELKKNQVAIYYKRENADYDGWGLWLWNNDGEDVLAKTTGGYEGGYKLYDDISDKFGAYYIIDLKEDVSPSQSFKFITRDSDWGKDCSDRVYSVEGNENDAFIMEGSCDVLPDPVEKIQLPFALAEAHLVNGTSLVWNIPADASSVELLVAEKGGIALNSGADGLDNADETLPLVSDGTLAEGDAKKYPGLVGEQVWTLPEGTDVKKLVKKQMVALAKDADGKSLKATSVQFPFALDALYFQSTSLKDAKLGATYNDDQVNIRLWAPTATKVEVQIADTADLTNDSGWKDMSFAAETGVWSYSAADLDRKFYRYRVTVYRRDVDKVVTTMVTDPYSLTVAANGGFTRIVDLDAAYTKPDGWDAVNKTAPEDLVVYETQIRDLTINDKLGDPNLDGKYKAFTEKERASIQQLQQLQEAGLTFVEVLPAFDLATVNEDPNKVANLGDTFSKLCELNPAVKESDFGSYCGSGKTIGDVFSEVAEDSDEKPQALNNYLREYDSFNWGYDPFHYTVPEGSYATDAADGITRIKEFRAMVKGLDDLELYIAMDVVYNHTNSAGTSEKSVLDKIVPDYYQRLDMTTGEIETSSCCSNTASEQSMMEKLMADSLEVWTRDYKIDGFRFDLMGLHTKANMQNIKTRLEAVNPDIYLYGEGWNMTFEGRGEQATQLNMYGEGIGTFTDRMRDAVRGGGPFDGGDDLRKNQGFGSGFWSVRNEMNAEVTEDDVKNELKKVDLIRVGLAGTLRDYELVNSEGSTVKGKDIDYNGAPGGYAAAPMEVVNYVSKHDNQTLFDMLQYKLDESVTAEQRMQMQVLSQALPILSQGVPFIHLGAELLRSKSMQRDSYDSGDWFNKISYDLDSDWNNNWNVGLPRKDKDGANWELIRKINAFSNIKMTPELAQLSKDLTLEYLKIRKSSDLFRLETLAEVQSVIKFHNTGPDQQKGLIVMQLDDNIKKDANVESIVVLVNATEVDETYSLTDAEGYRLHDVQKNSVSDDVKAASFANGTFTVPARTVSVFVK